MVSKQLLRYIEKEDNLKKSKKEIKEILISAGWHKNAVSEAFDVYYKKGKKAEAEVGDVDEGPTLVDSQGSDPRKVESEAKEVKPSIVEVSEKGTKSEKSPVVKENKRRIRPVFLIILSFVLGAAIMMAMSIFFLNNLSAPVIPQNNETGFVAQKIDDGKRIAEVLKIQDSLEKYYTEHKSYPENITSLTDVPVASSDLNYTYTSFGSPPQSYTLNIEVKNTDSGEFKIDAGFMTLKNKQGTK